MPKNTMLERAAVVDAVARFWADPLSISGLHPLFAKAPPRSARFGGELLSKIIWGCSRPGRVLPVLPGQAPETGLSQITVITLDTPGPSSGRLPV